MDTLIKIENIIFTIFDNHDIKKPQGITINTSLTNDLEMDSIMLAELSVRLEDEFGIDVFENGVVYSISEIVEKINNKSSDK